MRALFLILAAALVAGGCASGSSRPAPVSPATIQVAPDGKDSTCSRANASHPCRTLNRAYSLARPGDTIVMAGGTYAGQTIDDSAANGKPGTTPVTIEPAAGARVTVDGELDIGAPGTTSPVSYVTVNGHKSLTVNGGVVVGYRGSHDTVENLHVENSQNFSGGHLVSIEDGSYISILDNDIGPMCCDGDGIEVAVRSSGNPSPDHVTIAGNEIHDIYGSCREWPTRLGTCSAAGFEDAGQTTTLAADVGAGDTSLTVTRGFPWLATLGSAFFFVTIDSETMEVVGNASGTTWTIKRPGSCDQLGGSDVCGGTPVAHSAGATVAITDAFYDHVDGIQGYGCNACDFERNTFYLRGAYRQGLFLQSANGGEFSDITIANNMLTATSGGVTVSIAGPGTSVFSGYLRILYNTDLGTLLVYDSVVAPGTPVTIAGNIIEGTAGNAHGGGCTMRYGDGSTLRPTWSHNLTGARLHCGPGDLGGRATFVRHDFSGGLYPDLRLAAGSLGTGRGDPDLHPAVDIDGHVRPILLPPDIGASQRETASIIPGHSIGPVRLGEPESDVTAFYGPRSSKRAPNGASITTYHVHRGSLAITYDDSRRVVGIRTTSPYYFTATGVAVSASLPAGALEAQACPGYWRFPGAGGLYVTATSGHKASVASISVFAKKFAPC